MTKPTNEEIIDYLMILFLIVGLISLTIGLIILIHELWVIL